MPRQPVFAGLIIDENKNPVGHTYVGDEPMYVVDDAGFHRHIPSETVDRQVLEMMKSQVEGREDLLTDQTAKILGQEDPFSRAMILNQLRNIGDQMERLIDTGLPEDVRAYLGMMGLQIIINLHGEVIDVRQPGVMPGPGEGDE